MFSIRLFGSHMTFLFGSEGHEFFFMQPEVSGCAYRLTPYHVQCQSVRPSDRAAILPGQTGNAARFSLAHSPSAPDRKRSTSPKHTSSP